MKLFNYECFTTFWTDFSIAATYGIPAIKETYQRVFAEWKDDYKYLTELVIVLNHLGWNFYETGKNEKANVFFDLFREAQEYAYENLKGEELTYFIRTTD